MVKESLFVKGSESSAHDGLANFFLFRHRIDILNLDKCLQVILQHPSEVLLEFWATEVFDNSLPLGGLSEVTQVGPHVVTQDAEGCWLADTIRAYETENLAYTGRRESVQLEAISAISVSHLSFKALGKVDDFDGPEWAALDAHTTTVTQVLWDEANRRSGLHIDTEMARFVDWASPGALLPALLGFTLIWVDDCDSELLVCHGLLYFSPVAFFSSSKNYWIIKESPNARSD